MRYRGFGVTLESEIDLPLPEAEGLPDVCVRRAAGLPRPSSPARYLRVAPGRPAVAWTSAVVGETVTFWFADAGTLRVRGDESRIEVDCDGSQRRMQKYVMVTGLSCVLSADRLVLHGGAAAHDGAAVVVCGPSGRGKSTSIVGLARAGWAVLHDDLTVLTPDWTAHPGGRTALALPDAAAALGASGPLDPDGHVAVALDDADPARLEAVVLLAPRGRSVFRRLAVRDAAVRLGQETGWWSLLPAGGRRTRFELLGRLAEEVPCYEWSAPEGIPAATAVLHDLVGELIATPVR